MDIIRNGDEEHVFELGEEPVAEDEPAGPTDRRSWQVDTLFTPEALAMTGVILAVLAFVSPFFSLYYTEYGQFGVPLTDAWALGPHAAQGLAAFALGLAAWQRALATTRQVPRLAGVAVLLGLAVLAITGVLWWHDTPNPNEFFE